MISKYLQQILSARYGKDVRQSIHDSIKELNEVAVTAQGSATVNAQTAITKANEALAASQAATESAKQAKAYADNAKAVAGVTVATQDTAGLVKGGENHIGLDGTLELVVKTTEASMPNSRKGRVEVDEIGGVSKQDAVPTPDVPQEIKKSVVNVVKTHGKNLINQACVNVNEAGMHYLKAGTYTASRNESEGGTNWYLGAYDSNGNIITQNAIVTQDWALNGNQEFWYGGHIYNLATFTVNVDCYVKIGSLNGSGKTYFMLNEGTIAFPYEPYTESSITLSQPIELYGIGDVQDVIEDGKVIRRIGKTTANQLSAYRDNLVYGEISLPSNILKSTGWNDVYKSGLSNMFADVKSVNNMRSSTSLEGMAFKTNDDNSCQIVLRITGIEQTKEAYDTFLNNSPLEAIFELAEEVIEELPLADQIALNSLETFDGVTYFECDSEVQPTFAGKYGASLVGGIALEAYNQAHTHSRTVLWTNTGKGQQLGSNHLFQLPLKLYEQYEFYLVTYFESTSSAYAEKQVLMARAAGNGNGNNVSLGAVIKEGDTYHQHERIVKYSYDSQTFFVANCTYIDGNFNLLIANDKLIPYQIIGIR